MRSKTLWLKTNWWCSAYFFIFKCMNVLFCEWEVSSSLSVQSYSPFRGTEGNTYFTTIIMDTVSAAYIINRSLFSTLITAWPWFSSRLCCSQLLWNMWHTHRASESEVHHMCFVVRTTAIGPDNSQDSYQARQDLRGLSQLSYGYMSLQHVNVVVIPLQDSFEELQLRWESNFWIMRNKTPQKVLQSHTFQQQALCYSP